MNSTPIAVILAVLCRHSSVGSFLDLLLDLSPEISDTTAHMKSAQVHHPNSPAGASLQPESRLTPAGCGIRERSNEFAPTSWDKEVIIISSKRPRLGLGDRQTDSLPSVPADLQHHFQEPIKGSMHSFLTAAFNDPAIIHQPRMVKKIRSDCNDRAAYPLIKQDCAVDVVPNEIGPNFAVPHVMYDPKEFRLDWDDFQDNEHQQKILQEWQGNPSNLQTTGYDLVDQHRTGQNPHGFYEGRSQSFRNKTKDEFWGEEWTVGKLPTNESHGEDHLSRHLLELTEYSKEYEEDPQLGIQIQNENTVPSTEAQKWPPFNEKLQYYPFLESISASDSIPFMSERDERLQTLYERGVVHPLDIQPNASLHNNEGLFDRNENFNENMESTNMCIKPESQPEAIKKSLKLNQEDLGLYASIGWMYEQVHSTFIDELMHIYQNFLLKVGKVSQISNQNSQEKTSKEILTSYFLVRLLSQRYAAMEAGESLVCKESNLLAGDHLILGRLVALIRQVYCLNQRILTMFEDEYPPAVWENEQLDLHRWILQNIFLPLARKTQFNFSPQNTRPENEKVDSFEKIEFLICNYLKCDKEDLGVIKIIHRRSEKEILVELNQLLSRKTIASIQVLGSYYKNKNLEKWRTIFPDDEGFLKLLAVIKRNSFRRKCVSKDEKLKRRSGVKILPWENIWSDYEKKVASFPGIFQSFFCLEYERILRPILTVPHGEISKFKSLSSKKN